MINFHKRLTQPIKKETFPIYNDNSELNCFCAPYIEERDDRKVFVFEGYWSYYLDNLLTALEKCGDKMYIDIGRKYFVLTQDVKDKIDELVETA